LFVIVIEPGHFQVKYWFRSPITATVQHMPGESDAACPCA